MAYRKIHSNFWTDVDVEAMSASQKLFFLWLITNPANNQIGIYEFSAKRCSFETGLSLNEVNELLDWFIKAGKVARSTETNEICITKFYFWNKSNSPKLKRHVEQLLKQVRDRVLIQYLYSMDTLSQEEEDKEEEEDKIIALSKDVYPDPRAKPEAAQQVHPSEPPVVEKPVVDPIPTRAMFTDYCQMIGMSTDYANHIFDRMDAVGWVDNQQRPIRSWTSYANQNKKYQHKYETSLQASPTKAYQRDGELAGAIYRDIATGSGF